MDERPTGPTGSVPAPSWGDGPERSLMPSIPIFRALPGQRARLWILSHRMVYVGTHMVDGRTVPHVLPVQKCVGCANGQEIRGKGYLACLHSGRKRIVLAELTDRAIRYCTELMDRKESLRGRFLTVWRAGHSARSPVMCSVDGHQVVPQNYAEPDVQAQLLHIWGAPNREKPPEEPPDPDSVIPV